MTVIASDILVGAKQAERGGWMETATRVFMVKVPIDTSTTDTESVFRWALTLSEGVPKNGDQLSDGYPNLLCDSRACTIVGSDGVYATVKVECQYQLRMPGLVVLGDIDNNYVRPLRGSATVQQIETDVDKDNVKLHVHWPSLHPDDPESQIERTKIGIVLDVQRTIQMQMTVWVGDPDAETKLYINKVNSNAYRGDAIGLWLVTNINYDLVDAVRSIYTLDVELTHKRTGWKYGIVQDGDDGEPEPDASGTDGTNGRLIFEWHESVLFPPSWG